MNSQDDFFSHMLGELEYAEKKHEGWPEDPVHASAILNEEAGKLTQACIDYYYSNAPVASDENVELIQNMEKYALRVGAMALRFYNGMPAN